jgi:hypothetical protein
VKSSEKKWPKGKSEKEGAERRRSARKEVLETFHVFLVIPRSGLRKMYLKDVSDHGMGFYAEADDAFTSGEVIDCTFYINPSLKLPLSLKVAHVIDEGGRKKVGCEFNNTSTKAHKVFGDFMSLLNDLAAFLD